MSKRSRYLSEAAVLLVALAVLDAIIMPGFVKLALFAFICVAIFMLYLKGTDRRRIARR